jgi:hypothetical protein
VPSCTCTQKPALTPVSASDNTEAKCWFAGKTQEYDEEAKAAADPFSGCMRKARVEYATNLP